LNEMRTEAAAAFLDSLKEVALGAQLVLTSRVREYPSERVDYPVYQVKELDFPDEVGAFLTGVSAHVGLGEEDTADLLARAEADLAIRRLAANPYTLCQLARAQVLALPAPSQKYALLFAVADAILAEGQTLEPPRAHAFLGRLAETIQRREALA